MVMEGLIDRQTVSPKESLGNMIKLASLTQHYSLKAFFIDNFLFTLRSQLSAILQVEDFFLKIALKSFFKFIMDLFELLISEIVKGRQRSVEVIFQC